MKPALSRWKERFDKKNRRIKAIFIDRDGVINKDPGGWTKYNYVTHPVDFRFLPGALEALKKLKETDFKVIVISNQAGVNKGYFSKEELDIVNSKMLSEVSKHGGRIDESFYCIHRDEDNCNCRKPKIGLLEMAAKKYSVDPKNAYFIGDAEGDIIAGKKIGAKAMLVLSGKSTLRDIKEWEWKPDYVFNDLLKAVSWLLEKEKRKLKRAARREKYE